MTEGKLRVAIYARISQDSTGEALGVERQLDMARDLINARGWVEVAAYADNSISALSGKLRPQYAALMGAIERGELDAVVTYHLSRLWRNRVERGQGIQAFKRARVRIVSVKGPDFDLSTAYGASMIDILGAFDTMESEVKGERVRDQKRQRAEAGLWEGSATRPFGFAVEFDRPRINEVTGKPQKRRVVAVRVDPAEAEIVRELAARALAGETLWSMAADLNSRGSRTTQGNPWRADGVKKVLVSARISGRREVIPRLPGKAAGLIGEIVADGQWDRIISPEDSDRLRAILTAPKRRAAKGAARKSLLSGILLCGTCDRPMVSRPRSGVPRYVCRREPGYPGCGSTYTDAGHTNAWLRDALLFRLSDPAMVDRLRRRAGADPDLVDRIRADEERLEQLTADYHDPDMRMGRSEYLAGRRAIQDRLEANRARHASSSRTTALESFIGPRAEMAATWEAMTDAQRRPVVESVVEKIIVNKPDPAKNRFDRDRFALVWRDDVA